MTWQINGSVIEAAVDAPARPFASGSIITLDSLPAAPTGLSVIIL